MSQHKYSVQFLDHCWSDIYLLLTVYLFMDRIEDLPHGMQAVYHWAAPPVLGWDLVLGLFSCKISYSAGLSDREVQSYVALRDKGTNGSSPDSRLVITQGGSGLRSKLSPCPRALGIGPQTLLPDGANSLRTKVCSPLLCTIELWMVLGGYCEGFEVRNELTNIGLFIKVKQ